MPFETSYHLLQLLIVVKDRDAFILILIDGDGMIFDDQYIQKGENGGKEAAALLWGFVRDYVTQKIPNLSSDYKIVTRVYANIKGLGDACYRSGMLERASLIEDFARGFTRSKQLFDFVDVGMGKDRADDKISGTFFSICVSQVFDVNFDPEIFKLHLYDCHCRHILFGCSHDNGYARLLEDVADRQNLNRVTLLEGVPFERELAMLKSKYDATRFQGLFRTAKVTVNPQYYPQQQPLPSVQSRPQMTSMAPPPPRYQSPYQPIVALSSPVPTPNSSIMNPMAASWATAANSAPTHLASPPPTPQPTPPTNKVVPRNRYGQRVDPGLNYDKIEAQRVKKIKMCNIHYLRKDCAYGDNCTHDHSYAPNKNELQTLRYVARMTPCKFGSECDDIMCIYGHR